MAEIYKDVHGRYSNSKNKEKRPDCKEWLRRRELAIADGVPRYKTVVRKVAPGNHFFCEHHAAKAADLPEEFVGW